MSARLCLICNRPLPPHAPCPGKFHPKSIYPCLAEDCGRKFATQKLLTEHVRLDHVRPDDIPVPLNSRALPVVRSADPTAPYGRDENDKPLVLMRSDIQIAADLLDKPDLRGNNDPTQPVRPEPTAPRALQLIPETPEEKLAREELARECKEADALAYARNFFGVKPPTPKPKPAEKFVSYREALQLSAEDIIKLFDTPLPFTVSETETIKVLNTDCWLKRRIAATKLMVERHEKRIVGWSVVQLRRTRPDNIPDGLTREKFKREHKVKIKRLEEKLREYHERLRNFGSDPRDYHEVSKTVQREATLFDYDFPIEFIKRRTHKFVKDKLRTPKDGVPYYTELEVYDDEMELGFYDLERYKILATLGPDALDVSESTSPSGWKKWENAVIEKIVKFGLVPVSDPARILAPRLGVIEPDDVEADETENALISKTGGAAIGGRIFGRGWRWRPGSRTFVARKMDDFTMSIENRRDGAVNDHGGLAHDIDSGDWSPSDE